MEAAAKALRSHHQPVKDSDIITVIVEGKSPLLCDAKEHNARQPKWRHQVAVVRRWLREREWEWIADLFACAGISPVDRVIRD